ncbi:hypothetical protein [uncultured Thiodictyon sp.]|uniref:hypothetical protein n=1 Tax=uncultured Thiodictyon sp. TaxID=1846217 RepID=UPI0025F6C811|nr:hypothetical protein [uncultured Thiodictyon sp.]
MRKEDFIPATDQDLLAWLAQALGKLRADLAGYGVTEEELAELIDAGDDFRGAVTDALAAAAAAKAATACKKQRRERLETVLRKVKRHIKGHRGYTTAMGLDLGIVPPKHRFDLNTAKPDLAAIDQTGGVVRLTFTKYKSEGINIYCQREGDSGWVLVGRAAHSPWLDTRPLLQAGKAELRRYTAVYVRKDQEVGQFSNEVAVSCAP